MKTLTNWRMTAIYAYGQKEVKLETEDRDKALEMYEDYKGLAQRFNHTCVRGAILERIETFCEEEILMPPQPYTDADRERDSTLKKQRTKF